MLTDQELADLEAKYPRAIHVVSPEKEWELVVRPPTRPEVKRYRTQLRDPRYAADAVEILITAAVIYPDPPAFQALLDKYPLLCEGVSTVPGVSDMLGLSVQTSGK